ncbi:MAG TPA: TldD/PmbA family protein [Pseudonocardiaceae bacterium]|jgi:TldD protein|nr:TldD/PmbA family protein [Pseudonocardiaceae bacterium]
MSAELLSHAEAAELARVLRGQGPATLGLLRCSDTMLVGIRGEEVSSRRHCAAGSAVEIVGSGGRHHLFSPDCSAAALRHLAGTAAATSVPTRPTTAAHRTGELPGDIVTALPRLAGELADRMLTGQHRALQPIIDASASLIRIAVLRADGSVAADDRLHLELRIGARIAGAPGGARSLRVVSGSSLELLAGDDRHLAAAAEVACTAAVRSEAVDPPEGEMAVVLAPGSPAALLHEVCGHGMEVDVACAPAAAYHPPLGRRVAAPLVTVIDDPSMPRWAPLYRVDDEGWPVGRTVLIDRGTLAGYLTDGEGARRTGHPRTGNGRRLDHTHPALARMSCTYLAAGGSAPEEATAGVRRGLYVKSIVAGETNMSGGEFTVDVTESYWIENGRITAPVRAATLHGTGMQVLREIDVVCDDLDFFAYGFQCNKLSQFPLTVSVGQPTIRVRSMGVGVT